MNPRSKFLPIWLPLLLLAFSSPAWSQIAPVDIPLANPGFETPALNDGDLSFDPPDGWSLVGSNLVGALDASEFDYEIAVPEGENVAYVNGSSADSGLAQVLSGGTGTFQVDSDYSLSVKVGHHLFFDFPGYKIQLLAGGTVIAYDDNSTPPAQGGFITSTADYVYNAVDAALVGQPLQIRLLSKGLLDGEVHFDDVSLSVSPTVPVEDTTPPSVVSIVDNLNGGPTIYEDAVVTYTVTFDEAIDGTSVTASDFTNAGTATLASVAVTQNSTTTFTVVVDPSSTGTLQLRVLGISDLPGNTMVVPGLDPTVMTIGAGPTPPAIITGTAVGPGGLDGWWLVTDSWNNPDNWVGGIVPFSWYSAIIDTGVNAQVRNYDTQVYNGSLTMRADSTLQIGGYTAISANVNVLGTGGVTMYAGATILVRQQSNINYPALILEGNASIYSDSNQSHNKSYDVNSVSGVGSLAISGTNNNRYYFKASNPNWSGDLTISSNSNQNTTVEGDVTGCFGTGNVTSNDYTTLQIDASNPINDQASLSMSGSKDARRTAKLILNANQAVGRFWVGGVQLAAGTYKSNSGLLDSAGNNLIAGGGTLTVKYNPGINPVLLPVNFVDNNGGAPVLPNETVVYTLTFSKAMNPATITTDDFRNAGTAVITVDSVSATGSGAVFLVTVTPLTAGTIALQAKSDAVLEDLAGNAVVELPATDNTTITVDNTKPFLVASKITDNKGGGPVMVGETVIYYLEFSESMNPATITTADFGNAGSADISIDSVSATNHGARFNVYVTPLTAGTIALQVKSDAVLEDVAGNAMDVLPVTDNTTITVDAIKPVLLAANIVDNKSGGPVAVSETVVYTLTFSEAMNPATVNTADFGNAGTAGITVASVTGNGAVFLVSVTPNTAGTIALQAKSDAVLEDIAGNAADVPVTDDTTITVQSPDPFLAWSGGALFGDDDNADGIKNGLAWILGAPDKDVSALGLLPAATKEPGFLTLTFERANPLGSATLSVDYGGDMSLSNTDLIPATTQTLPSGVEVVVVSGSPTDTVTLKIPASFASPSGGLFARLGATEN